MSFATAHTIVLRGAEGHLVDVQADVSPGVVGTTLTGRIDKSVTEAKDRVRMAMSNSGGTWPATKRVTVLLGPADLPKAGTHLDLAIALSITAADRAADDFAPAALAGYVLIGELSVSGALRPVQGVLPMVIAAARHGITRVVVPEPQAAEAALVPGVTVFGMRSLDQVRAHLTGREIPEAPPVVGGSGSSLTAWRGEGRLEDLDMSDLDGLEDVRFAVEVAAAGGHPLMLMGPRGVGKTSIAERIPSILPDLDIEESLEVSALHSVAGTLQEGGGLLSRPPWFAPHHSASASSILGGGSGRVRPGQVSLAHHGVLFLDEFPHFRADVVEALREPLEAGEVTLARGEETATYPAQCLFVLAANPCQCGNYHRSGAKCECTALMRQHYQRKLSGPVVDRVDIWMEVQPEGQRPFRPKGEGSAAIRARVTAARARQLQRYEGCRWRLNAAAPGPALAERWPLDPGCQALIDEELGAGRLSRRGVTRVHRLAWTVADLMDVAEPREAEVRTALILRSTDTGQSLPSKVLRRVS